MNPKPDFKYFIPAMESHILLVRVCGDRGCFFIRPIINCRVIINNRKLNKTDGINDPNFWIELLEKDGKDMIEFIKNGPLSISLKTRGIKLTNDHQRVK